MSDNRNINTSGGNYNENIRGDYIEGDKYVNYPPNRKKILEKPDFQIPAKYKQLKALLEQNPKNRKEQEEKWKEADRETLRTMLKIIKPGWREKLDIENIGWLDAEDIANFPKEDLVIIDKLWKHYSDGNFGFSVQKEIWEGAGGKINSYDPEVFKKFGRLVGWYKFNNNFVSNMFKGGWLWLEDVNFTDDAQRGHLPWSVLWNGPVGLKRNASNDVGVLNFGSQDTKDVFLALMKKFED